MLLHFIGDDVEPDQPRVAELGGDRNVRGVAAPRDDDPPYAWNVVPCVEGKPPSVQKHFEPRAEIHWRRIFRHADIAKISRAVPSGNVHAAAKGHRQMREIAADADALFVTFRRGSVTARVVVTEIDAVMYVIADRLDPLPAAGQMLKQRPGELCQLLRVAVPASIQERQNVVGQLVDIPLTCFGGGFFRKPAVTDEKVCFDFKKAWRRNEACPHVAKRIAGLP
jgi:hypothetical protein